MIQKQQYPSAIGSISKNNTELLGLEESRPWIRPETQATKNTYLVTPVDQYVPSALMKLAEMAIFSSCSLHPVSREADNSGRLVGLIAAAY